MDLHEKLSRALSGEVIAAVATPHGRAALGILRISGEGAIDVVQRCLSPSPPISDFPPNRASVVKLRINGVHERAVATVFKKPKSYTGEDMVELSLHGNPVLLRLVLDRLTSCGARLAFPGEFTLRAIANGKMNPIEAEAVLATVSAQTERALFAARRTAATSQKLRESWRRVRDVLVEMVASLEFPEDDLPQPNIERWVDELEAQRRVLLDVLRRASASRALDDGVVVVIAGEPNAGKSTLFNRIVGAERAIVTPHPGTTRDIIEATVEIGGIPVKLLDTAGIREAEHPVEVEGIRRAESALQSADVVVWVVDGSAGGRNPPPLETNNVVVLNKSDLGLRREVCARFPEAIPISALKGDGVEDLLEKLESLVADVPADAVMLTARTESLVAQAADELCVAVDALKKSFIDVAQAVLERAEGLLAQIAAPGEVESVYEEIFERFCVGK